MTSESSRLDWDQRYRETAEKWLAPSDFFVEAYEQFVTPAFPQPGRALDLAGGMGRHALYLAQRGWDVTLLDISAVALAQAQALAKERGLSLKTEHRDLTGADLPADSYDLIVVFFYLDRSLFSEIAAALRPGGLLIYQTYTLEQLNFGKSPSDPAFLLQAGELKHAFPDLAIMSYSEHLSDKAVAELVARRE